VTVAGKHPVVEPFVEVLKMVPESALVARLFVHETKGEPNLLSTIRGVSDTPVVARAVFLATLPRSAWPEKA